MSSVSLISIRQGSSLSLGGHAAGDPEGKSLGPMMF